MTKTIFEGQSLTSGSGYATEARRGRDFACDCETCSSRGTAVRAHRMLGYSLENGSRVHGDLVLSSERKHTCSDCLQSHRDCVVQVGKTRSSPVTYLCTSCHARRERYLRCVIADAVTKGSTFTSSPTTVECYDMDFEICGDVQTGEATTSYAAPSVLAMPTDPVERDAGGCVIA
jgi:hypothetical protein